jgi:hypothetical protein
MREILATLAQAYDHPVDVEFTANFFGNRGCKINIVQCRPFLVNRSRASSLPPVEQVTEQRVILKARGAVIGPSRTLTIDRLICVMPAAYAGLTVRERYRVARAIGELTHQREANPPETIMLLGPGRWGTSTPSLGVPVQFAEINTASVICELVAMGNNIVPDVSLGAHFFNDFVEQDILYLALFPGRRDNDFSEEFFESQPNRLATLLPSAAELEQLIRVVDSRDLAGGRKIWLHANAVDQTVVCYAG